MRSAMKVGYRAFGYYAQGVGRRGRIHGGEVLGLRVLLDQALNRPDFAPRPGTLVERVDEVAEEGRVRGEWVEHPDVRTRTTSVLLYVHGGAFVAGSLRSHRGLTSELALRAHRSVFSVDYRLAPRYPFPAAELDVVRAYAWLLASGVPAGKIVVVGDSAGGHLALAMPSRAVRSGLEAPAGVAALSPVIDPSMDLSRALDDGKRRPDLITSDLAAAAMSSYLRRADPGAADLTAGDLSVMPAVLVQAGKDELLAGQAQLYVDALRAAGGTADLSLWPRQPHVFQVAHRISRTASRAVDELVDFIERVTDGGE